MRELILFRHAKAEAAAPQGDRARVLTQVGRDVAVGMGEKLAAQGLSPDLALVSARAEVVIVVGHNPGLQSYAVDLLQRGGGPARALSRVAAGFPPATAAVFTVDEAGRASLDAIFDPRDLGGE